MEGNITENLPLTRPRKDNDTGDERSHDTNNVTLAHETAKLLALPSPIDVLGPEEGSWRSWLSLSSWVVAGQRYKGWMFRRRVDTRGFGGRGGRDKRWQIFGMRILRNCLLIVKVLRLLLISIEWSLTCPNIKISIIPRDPLTRPHPAITAFLLGAAVTDSVLDHDTWEMSLLTTTGLALVHLVILGVAGSGIWNWAYYLPLHPGQT